MSRTVHRFQSASVTIPESLMKTFGNAARGFRRAAHSLLRNVRRKVDPSDNARDEVMLRGRCEKLARFIEARSRLHEDRLVDAVRGEQRLQVLGPEPPADRRERLGHPRVGRLRRVPEVLVSVDHECHAAPFGYAYSRSEPDFISML